MKPDEIQQLIATIQSYAAVTLLIAGLAGVAVARFLLSFRATMQRDVATVQTHVETVQTHVETVKAEIPAQVQSHIEKPISDLQTQIDKSMTDLARTGSTFAITMNDLIANYQNQATNYERQIALVSQQLQHTLEQNHQLEKQLFDHKVFTEDLQKGRVKDFERIHDLELKQRQMEDIQQAQAEGSKARDKRIKELQERNDEAQREVVKLRAAQADNLKQIDLMREQITGYTTQLQAIQQERDAYQGQIAELRSEITRLHGIESERALLIARVAALQTQSTQDQQRITELETEVARLGAHERTDR